MEIQQRPAPGSWHTNTYDLGGVTLHGVSMGAGPTVLLLHGISSNAYIFLPMMEALAGRFHVLAVDMRGHGRSTKPPSGYTAADYAGDLAKLIEKTGGPVIVAGHALGAKAALQLAVSRPDLVLATVAIDFVPFIEPQVFAHLEERVLGGHRVYDNLVQLREALARRYPRMPTTAIERRSHFGFAQGPRGLEPLVSRDALSQSVADLKQPLEGLFARVACPTLLIRGKESAFVSVKAWEKSKAARPEFRAVEIPDADHYVCEEAPAAIAGEIARLYDGLIKA